MFKWKSILQTKNITKWVNKCEYIIVHHCWWTNVKVNLDILLWNTPKQVSAHILIDWDWFAYKLADPRHITWHAWFSQWWMDKDSNWSMNWLAIWIELTWPYPWIWFTDKQKDTLRQLIQHLMYMYDIPKENVLRHADITWIWAKDMKYWDNKSLNRKIDIDIRITGWLTWREYVNKLVPKEQKDVYVNQDKIEELRNKWYSDEKILELLRKKYWDNSEQYKSFAYYIK